MIKTDIRLNLKYRECDIAEAIRLSLPMENEEIKDAHLIKRTLVIKDTERPYYKCTVAFSTGSEKEAGLLKMRKRVSPYDAPEMPPVPYKGKDRPVVVGAGPSGLFCALYLAECGARPILLERGGDVKERVKRVSLFNTLGVLDPECNVQFGEGGAGTFSDGKLKVGGHDKYKDKVLLELISAGADGTVFYSDTAHVGTDRLPSIMENIRERIISLGGEVYFGAKFTRPLLNNGITVGLEYEMGGNKYELLTDNLVLAIGHSARDTIRALYSQGVYMEPKGFGIGMRVEHPREYINRLVYGEHASEIEDTASYHLVTHLPSGRSVYSFCMCPGGTVVAATGQEGAVVTNGMSESRRMGDNSNAAILVSATPEDFPDSTPLGGIALQEQIERLAYGLASEYKAPCCSLSDIMSGGSTASLPDVMPSYGRGTELVSPRKYLPDFVTDSLQGGFSDFDAWMDGFSIGGAALTGPETRTTSPVKMTRTETREALGISGLYPVGEGAGYAGGIISSAQDGLRTAEAIVNKYL